MFDYATKADFKNAASADTSKFAKEIDLANLKSNIDKLDIDKLKNVTTNLRNLKSKEEKLYVGKWLPVPVDLSKLSDVVKNDAIKKDTYNAKIKRIEDKIPDITNLATNTTLNAKIYGVTKKITSITNLATSTTALNAKTKDGKNKIPNIASLATTTTTALTAVENEIPNDSNLVKKTDYNTKISKTENKITTAQCQDKCITTQGFNKLTSESFAATQKQGNLASKSDIDNNVKKKKVYLNKIELNELSKKVKSLSTKKLRKDLINKFSIHNEAKYFSSGIFQNYLVFTPGKKCIRYFSGTTWINSWKPNGIPEENITIEILHQLLLIIIYYQI